MFPKVTIRTNSKKRNKGKHWWIRCLLCGTKSHVRQSNWNLAIKMAGVHIQGRAHQQKLAALESQSRWQKAFS